MTLESIYYFFGILFYISWLVLVIFLIVVLWKGYKAIEQAPEQIKQKVMSIIPADKNEIIGMVGMVATTFLINQFKNIFRRK